jgi:hypothetical protein
LKARDLEWQLSSCHLLASSWLDFSPHGSSWRGCPLEAIKPIPVLFPDPFEQDLDRVLHLSVRTTKRQADGAGGIESREVLISCKAVDAYKKDTGKTPTIKVDHKTGQIVIRLGKGESALSFRLKYL